MYAPRQKVAIRMFSGIVETQSKLTFSQVEDHLNSESNLNTQKLRIRIEKPIDWSDLKRGDSIALNGICLTLETFSETELEFILGPETLKVIQSVEEFFSRPINLERSLLVSSRIHGHLVLGHVDGMAKVVISQGQNNIHYLSILLPESFAPLVWYKGSISLSGVSLTINQVHGSQVDVCLIPETVRATNLTHYQVGNLIPFEIDNMARGLARLLEYRNQTQMQFLNTEDNTEKKLDKKGENHALNS
jgi:riboflavin synthase